MNKKLLFENYATIEKKLYTILDFLEQNKENVKYKDLYKGFITLQSPLIFNPDILFIGINPGQGAFKENGSKTPIRIFNPEIEIKLDWYKNGNARCEKNKNEWIKAYEWYQKDKGINNIFIVNMLQILYKVAELQYPDKELEKNKIPFWYESLGQNIMFTNLYPIATKNIKDLRTVFENLTEDESLNSLFGQSKSKSVWYTQRYFIQRIEELVQLVQPKAIVCVGTHAFNDFTFTHERRKSKVFKTEKKGYPTIGFSRLGNWSGLIPEIAKEIVASIS